MTNLEEKMIRNTSKSRSHHRPSIVGASIVGIALSAALFASPGDASTWVETIPASGNCTPYLNSSPTANMAWGVENWGGTTGFMCALPTRAGDSELNDIYAVQLYLYDADPSYRISANLCYVSMWGGGYSCGPTKYSWYGTGNDYLWLYPPAGSYGSAQAPILWVMLQPNSTIRGYKVYRK